MTIRATILISAMVCAAAPAIACAEQSVRVEHAAARVIVIPEARQDVSVTIDNGRAGLTPMQIRHDGGVLVVDGGLEQPHVFGVSFGWNGLDCHGTGDRISVRVPGKGDIAVRDLPLVTIHTPLDSHVGASGAVYGEIGAAGSLELANAGCGDWKIADVRGPLHVALSGSGDVRGAAAGATRLHISGSGDVTLGAVNGGFETSTSGSGDIRAASVRGPITSRIAGSGNVVVDGGDSPKVGVSIAGSGDFKFRGTAGAVSAAIAGSGDVSVAKATGPISKHVVGSGDVTIGS